MTRALLASLLMLCLALAEGPSEAAHPEGTHKWSEEEAATIRSLWIGSLGALPDDPSNSYDTDPRAVELGRRFFFDVRFSGNKRVSCATCHREEIGFTDNLPLAHGMGTTSRRTMPLIGMAYQSWFFWDGRKDSMWAQALGPIENPVEHGFTRTLCFIVISEHYGDEYEEVFGPLPEVPRERWPALARPAPDDPAALKAWVNMPDDMRMYVNEAYANMGKAIAAYVRTIVPGAARFDRYAEAVISGDKRKMARAFTAQEAQGLRLFIGKAGCINCHNGPLFTNGGFHDVGVAGAEGAPGDPGRAEGIVQALSDEFNCLSDYSDAAPRQCLSLRFVDTDKDKYVHAFKTPTLRNVAERPPYMHAGQRKTLAEVLEHYRDLRPGGSVSAEIAHGGLGEEELRALEAFLRTLSGPLYQGGEKLPPYK